MTKAETRKVSAFCYALVALAALALALPQSVEAQRQQDLQLGAQIRFRPTAISDWREATVEASSADSIRVRLCVACKSEIYAYSDLDRIEARTRTPGNHLRVGALLGALVGVGVDGLLTAQCYHNGRGNELVGLCGLGLLYTPVFGLGGALVGGVVGAQIPNRGWVTVYRKSDHT